MKNTMTKEQSLLVWMQFQFVWMYAKPSFYAGLLKKSNNLPEFQVVGEYVSDELGQKCEWQERILFVKEWNQFKRRAKRAE